MPASPPPHAGPLSPHTEHAESHFSNEELGPEGGVEVSQSQPRGPQGSCAGDEDVGEVPPLGAETPGKCPATSPGATVLTRGERSGPGSGRALGCAGHTPGGNQQCPQPSPWRGSVGTCSVCECVSPNVHVCAEDTDCHILKTTEQLSNGGKEFFEPGKVRRHRRWSLTRCPHLPAWTQLWGRASPRWQQAQGRTVTPLRSPEAHRGGRRGAGSARATRGRLWGSGRLFLPSHGKPE